MVCKNIQDHILLEKALNDIGRIVEFPEGEFMKFEFLLWDGEKDWLQWALLVLKIYLVMIYVLRMSFHHLVAIDVLYVNLINLGCDGDGQLICFRGF